MKRVALLSLCALALFACDKTAEVACENASCPPGTTIDLEAASSNACEGSASGTYDANILGASAEGEISGQCFSTGSCVYACYVNTECCGSEEWTETSYSCDNPCTAACGNGECEAGEDPTQCPQDCAANCGNDECEYGEVCVQVSCADLTDDSDCAICPQDCCPICGNGICEYPEDGALGNDPCEQDCGGDVCQPSCTPPDCGADDGCGGSCAGICPGGFYCGDEGTCVKGGTNACEGGCPEGQTCVNGACRPACPDGCPEGQSCVDEQCVQDTCIPECPELPGCGGSNGCGGQCICPDNRDCLNGQCQPGNSCEPDCNPNNCSGDDGCGGTCQFECPEGMNCVENACTDPGGQSAACSTSMDCGEGERCDSGTCAACPVECDNAPCNQNGCQACGMCPGDKICTDEATCVGG